MWSWFDIILYNAGWKYIYPCAYVTNDEAFKIGNIKNGIDIELAQNLPRELFFGKNLEIAWNVR